MYRALLLALALVIVSTDIPPKMKDDSAYQAWKSKHGMAYDEMEDRYRMFLFAQKEDQIKSHNKNKHHTWKKAHNQFSCLTSEEFQSIFLTNKPPRRYSKSVQQLGQTQVQSNDDSFDSSSQDLSENDPNKVTVVTPVNWVKQGKVTSVKEQKMCGSCWTFATAGAIEAAYLIKHGTTYDLSEQQLVDCAHQTEEKDEDKDGCNGGWQEQALDYIITENLGITTEEKYPYVGTYQKECKKYGGDVKVSTYLHSQILHRCRGLQSMAKLSPVSISVDATIWHSYGSGVFNTECERNEINHAVLLVGFDENENWHIKNSWGTFWGEDGYMFLRKGNCHGICREGGTMVLVP